MSPKTIDIQSGSELLREVDPIGLLPEPSVRRFQERLRERIRQLYPEARVFLRWSPSCTDGADVYTIPRAEDAEAKVLEAAREVLADADEWTCYDEGVRAALAA